MSAPSLRVGSVGGVHPALLSRRMRELLVTAVTGLVVLVVALTITTGMPEPNVLLVCALALAGLGIVAFIISPRYEVTLTLVTLYLGLLDGPVKLMAASQAASAVRDVLIFAVVLGMLARMSVSQRRVAMPPLSGWVVLFSAAVLVQALNPQTGGILKILGGFRQQLEWVPFFFFGYLMLRSKDSFRKLFLVLGVIALANGAVGTYQSRLSPEQLGTWGPGYNADLTGSGGSSGRTYSVEGVSRPRPPALGSDSGFGGGAGNLAIPGLLALLSVGRMRRRWVPVLLIAGAVLGIATSASRTAIIIAVVALLSYAGLSLLAGLRIGRPLAALLAVIALAVGVGAVLVAVEGPGVFQRQESVTSLKSAETSGANAKVQHLSQLPRIVLGAPLGSGLGTGGSAGGFGGKQKVQIEGQGVSAEGAYLLVGVEVGLPGLLLWLGLTLSVIFLAVTRLRSIADVELRTYLVAVFAVYIAITAEGFSGPTLAVTVGAFLWFAPGVAAYWLAGPGWAASRAITRRASFRPMSAAAAA